MLNRLLTLTGWISIVLILWGIWDQEIRYQLFATALVIFCLALALVDKPKK